jgi:glyceraldehyde 3-phosphate dehydrogenase
MKIAINGFGRIGRALLRASLDRPELKLEVVAINDLSSFETMAHLVKYDSVHGKLKADVSLEGHQLLIDNHSIVLSSEKEPDNIQWGDVDYVCECTGVIQSRVDLNKHIANGAKRVLLSGPASENVDKMVVYGVNHLEIGTHHRLLSNASCTTNCLAPVVKVLNDQFGVVEGSMVTVHAYTSDQRLIDAPHSDLRRSRAAALSMIPTKTGAAKAIASIIPELAGLLDGYALRVPTANVSMVDLTCRLNTQASIEEIKSAFIDARNGELAGILDVSEEPLVSCDYNHTTFSATVDALEIRKVGQLYKILAWYDNEWGFVNRMLDVMHYAKV